MVASAQVTQVSPDFAAKARAFAEQAKRQYQTSPTEAANRFIADFNGEFGDIIPIDNKVVDRPDLLITFATPIVLIRQTLLAALQQLQPLPEAKDLLFDIVVVDVQPRQRSAPNVQKVVVFRGDAELRPIDSTLALREFKNAFGVALRQWPDESHTVAMISRQGRRSSSYASRTKGRSNER
jgi:hypothetical protein